jgi:alkanesulfonate monooxygenase SsuD/methylene tetrahydromethanopterin reductase-like flavin-dependent oxidoreductase (luciferase family)
VLAKQLATLDVLSDGRVDLGVGVGWQKEEYDAAGLPFAGRGRLLDHTLEVCQTLWTENRASYVSPELSFDGIHQMPKPVQAGGVPCWISGTVNDAVARRIARFGRGWIPWGSAFADLPQAITDMKDKVRQHGGDPTDLQVQGSARAVKRDDRSIDYEASVAVVPALVAAGVTDVRFTVAVPDDGDEAVGLLSPLVKAFREATR